MDHPLTIFWPTKPPPEISEIQFSYAFCKKMSRRFCEMSHRDALWFDYHSFEQIEALFAKAQGHTLILVTEPAVVLSPNSIRILHDLSRSGIDACAPVYHQTAFSAQLASLPAQYVDMDTFLEVSDIMAQTEHIQTLKVDCFDPACISFRIDFLKEIKTKETLTTILQDPITHASKPAAVAKGALVHSGFLKTFRSQRDDLVRLVPEGVKNVLDVGCAMGGYGKTLKGFRPNIHITGVELNSILVKIAEPIYDEIINEPLEQARFSTEFDLINCGDILEHLVNPWRMLKRLNNLLKKSGYLVLSIPNAGHWSIVRALAQGKFQYVPLGLLCIGHLRWFTEDSIRRSLLESGFSVEVFKHQQIPPTPLGEKFIRDVSGAGYGNERSLRTDEFIIRALKP
jgi:2-polyprenyl-3-methyl-5-hydroxy-6-metoxy-1,4-benzoquinol methylase